MNPSPLRGSTSDTSEMGRTARTERILYRVLVEEPREQRLVAYDARIEEIKESMRRHHEAIRFLAEDLRAAFVDRAAFVTEIEERYAASRTDAA